MQKMIQIVLWLWNPSLHTHVESKPYFNRSNLFSFSCGYDFFVRISLQYIFVYTHFSQLYIHINVCVCMTIHFDWKPLRSSNQLQLNKLQHIFKEKPPHNSSITFFFLSRLTMFFILYCKDKCPHIEWKLNATDWKMKILTLKVFVCQRWKNHLTNECINQAHMILLEFIWEIEVEVLSQYWSCLNLQHITFCNYTYLFIHSFVSMWFAIK